MSNADVFMNNPRVVTAVSRAKACSQNPFSDIVDGEGNQYVDLVMEGGGVLGIALVGYTHVLEQTGIRFLGIGGASAGAINALMIAAIGRPSEAKSRKLIGVLADMPMASFIDGDADARDFSKAVIERSGMIKLLWKAAQIMDNLKDDLGLNPGDAFLKWLTKELEANDIVTTQDLLNRLSDLPKTLRVRNGIRTDTTLTDEERAARLAMVAADITTESKVEFPKMAQLYWKNPMSVNPACFARASMSIPFFFHPFRVHDCPQNMQQQWASHVNYHGILPKTVMFMDGGIMSNFPINLFHEPNDVPLAPTFGVKIGVDRSKPAEITKPAQLLGAIFNAARHTMDEEFVTQNPDYRHLVKMIETGDHNWLNFSMPLQDKLDLFARGAEAAADFVCGFDWQKYKSVRRDLAKAWLKKAGLHQDTAFA